MKRLVTGCVVALAFVLAGAGAANAGEATGNGGEAQGASHASSECAFSGQDTEDSLEGNPPGFDDDMLAMRGSQKHGYHGIQSYGMFVSAGIDVGVNPGMACRGNAGQ